MSFIHAEGTLLGAAAEVRWEDGKLTGAALVTEEVELHVGQRVCVPGVWAGEGSLSDPIAAMGVILAALDPQPQVDTDVDFGSIPDGTVA